MDFVWAALFLLWYEALTLPARAALAAAPAPADVRRVLSRVAGPLLVVLPIWLAAHVAGFALARGTGTGWLIVAAVLAARPWRSGRSLARILAYRDGTPSNDALRRQLALDGLTVAVFFGFVVLRRWVPEMTTYPIDSSAAEKFMNAMIFWSSWHAPDLPPEDYWLAGHPLTYYYWGHFFWAWVGRVGGFPAELALNLGFARTVTLVFEAGYLLARAVGMRGGWAAAAALAVTWAGNPSAVAETWRVWRSSAGGYNWEAYNFWKPSRAMTDSVIDEFPAFSAILGDFHAHHLALPWIVGWFALSLAGARWLALRLGGSAATGRPPSAPPDTRAGALGWLALGLAAGLANLWNLPLIAFGIGLLWLHALLRGGRAWRHTLALGLGLALLVGIGMLLLLDGAARPLPAQPDASFWERLPLRPLPAELRSTVPQLFSMWGLPVLILGVAALVRAGAARHREAVGAVLLGWVILATASNGVASVLPGGTAWAWGAVGCWVLSLALGPEPWLSGRAVRMLLPTCVVLAGLELVFVNDAYVGEYERYNSYFKLSYPMWACLWVGAFAAASRLWAFSPGRRGARPLRFTLRAGLVVTLAAGIVYPVCAIPARVLSARRGEEPARRPTLDAVAFLENRPAYAAEAPLLAWIRTHVPPGQVVAEGVGTDSYGYVGRVASLAGRPVPLGWAHHERQWRGRSGHRLTAERKAAIDGLYRAETPEQMRAEAGKLGVEWVVYGVVERQRYGDPQGDERVLRMLRRTAPLAAAFPADRPTAFVFDFRETRR